MVLLRIIYKTCFQRAPQNVVSGISKWSLICPNQIQTISKKSFGYSAASQWNNLPNNLRTIESVRSFKREVNRFYQNEG